MNFIKYKIILKKNHKKINFSNLITKWKNYLTMIINLEYSGRKWDEVVKSGWIKK
jgi:hypothetical protein